MEEGIIMFEGITYISNQGARIKLKDASQLKTNLMNFLHQLMVIILYNLFGIM